MEIKEILGKADEGKGAGKNRKGVVAKSRKCKLIYFTPWRIVQKTVPAKRTNGTEELATGKKEDHRKHFIIGTSISSGYNDHERDYKDR